MMPFNKVKPKEGDLMHRQKNKKNRKLRKSYVILLEVGLVVTLLIFIGIFTMRLPAKKVNKNMVKKQEVVDVKDIVRTKQKKTPPTPPKPQVPVEVPNDEVVKEQNFNLNADLNMGNSLDIPKPPEQKKKKEDKDDHVFVAVEQQPKLDDRLNSLQKKIQYHEMARKAGIEGRVYVQFVVNKKGQVKNPHVIRGIGGGCDKEALRVIKQAKFKPGLQRGRPVKVQMSLPIVFRLQK